MLANFAYFLSFADFPFKINIFAKFFRDYHQYVKQFLDPDQARHFVGPDLDPKCLQWLSAYDTSRQRINALRAHFTKLADKL